MSPATQQVIVSALYHFVRLYDYQSRRQPLHDFMIEHKIRGTLLLVRKGINGTVAGSKKTIDKLHSWLDQTSVRSTLCL